jgi:hypothetical protein
MKKTGHIDKAAIEFEKLALKKRKKCFSSRKARILLLNT